MFPTEILSEERNLPLENVKFQHSWKEMDFSPKVFPMLTIPIRENNSSCKSNIFRYNSKSNTSAFINTKKSSWQVLYSKRRCLRTINEKQYALFEAEMEQYKTGAAFVLFINHLKLDQSICMYVIPITSFCASTL